MIPHGTKIIEVTKIMGKGKAYQAHLSDGRTYHGSAASQQEFERKISDRLLAEENDEAPDPRYTY